MARGGNAARKIQMDSDDEGLALVSDSQTSEAKATSPLRVVSVDGDGVTATQNGDTVDITFNAPKSPPQLRVINGGKSPQSKEPPTIDESTDDQEMDDLKTPPELNSTVPGGDSFTDDMAANELAEIKSDSPFVGTDDAAAPSTANMQKGDPLALDITNANTTRINKNSNTPPMATPESEPNIRNEMEEVSNSTAQAQSKSTDSEETKIELPADITDIVGRVPVIGGLITSFEAADDEGKVRIAGQIDNTLEFAKVGVAFVDCCMFWAGTFGSLIIPTFGIILTIGVPLFFVMLLFYLTVPEMLSPTAGKIAFVQKEIRSLVAPLQKKIENNKKKQAELAVRQQQILETRLAQNQNT